MRRAAASLLAIVGSIPALLVTGEASAATVVPVDSGDVIIADADDPSTALTGGDGTTAFVVRLPDGSACPGDSFNDQWRVQSFMIPANDDVGSLSYGVIGPEGEQQLALFGADEAASSFANILMPANSVAGQPGRIASTPPFSLAVAAGETISSGTYRIGIACTLFGDTDRYWDAEIEVSQASNGLPDDLSWRLSGTPVQPEERDDGALRALPVVSGVVGAVAIGGFVLSRIVLRRYNSRSKEPK